MLIIVLENADYERAIQDPSLRGLAIEGASLTNFHALFHPPYPNYLAMIAGTDFGLHRRGSFLADRQVNFANDSAHRTIADKRGNYVRRHLPFLSFREVQEKWCDHVIAVDSVKADHYFIEDANRGLVAYSFYTPNMNHNGHDTNAEVAGAWVKRFLDETFPRKPSQGHAGGGDLRRMRRQPGNAATRQQR